MTLYAFYTRREFDAQELPVLLSYDEKTGRLYWRERPQRFFQSARCANVWNAKYSGKEAFTTTSPNGYKQGAICGKNFFAHRVIWCLKTGSWPSFDIDHINRDRCDNRWCNLREATRSENMRNALSRAGASSRFLGVSWASDRQKWVANITQNRRAKHLGYFDQEERAALAYDAAAKAMHGQFARLNFGGAQ